MYYSEKYNMLFIASPKTGSQSVFTALFKIDKNGVRTKIKTPNGYITKNDVDQGSFGHIRAREIKKAMGDKAYNQLNTFAFVRNPYSKLVSTFSYNRKGSFFSKRKNSKSFSRTVIHFLSVLIAKYLPFELWVFIHPFRTNSSYILDYNGERIVKYLGRTEHLNDDFQYIMKQIGVDTNGYKIERINTSSHKPTDAFFKNKFFKKLIDIKIRKDVELYNEIVNEFKDMEKSDSPIS